MYEGMLCRHEKIHLQNLVDSGAILSFKDENDELHITMITGVVLTINANADDCGNPFLELEVQ